MSSDGDAGDVKTLRMATPELSREALRGYLEYQRAFLQAVEAQAHVSHPFGWEGRFARADELARVQSGLDAEQVSRMRALCDDYCGRQTTAERLRQAAEDGSLETEVAEKARARAQLLASLELLRERYGEGWLEALEALRPELLDLHQRINRRLV